MFGNMMFGNFVFFLSKFFWYYILIMMNNDKQISSAWTPNDSSLQQMHNSVRKSTFTQPDDDTSKENIGFNNASCGSKYAVQRQNQMRMQDCVHTMGMPLWCDVSSQSSYHTKETKSFCRILFAFAFNFCFIIKIHPFNKDS